MSDLKLNSLWSAPTSTSYSNEPQMRSYDTSNPGIPVGTSDSSANNSFFLETEVARDISNSYASVNSYTGELLGIAGREYADDAVRLLDEATTHTNAMAYATRATKGTVFSTAGTALKRSAPVINVATGYFDAKAASQIDAANNDVYKTETVKSVSGSLGSYLLGGAAVATTVALGTAFLPATALVVGAGFAGDAIGKEIGGWGVGLAKWWNS